MDLEQRSWNAHHNPGSHVRFPRVMISVDYLQEDLPSFSSWQLLSDTVEFPRAFMLRRMNHNNPPVDFDAP
jgi:hypothetical protein